MNPRIYPLLVTTFWLSLVFLLALIIFVIIAIRKVHIKYYDSHSIIIIASYLISLSAKIAGVSIFIYDYRHNEVEEAFGLNIANIINMGSDITIWFFIFVFIFDMKHFGNLVESKTHLDFLEA